MPDFISDGCTHWFDGSWRECCYDHDLAYYADSVTLQSHIDLGLSVAEMGGAIIIGVLMTFATTAWWISKHARRRRKL